MANYDVDHLISLLKFLDENFLEDDQFKEVGDLNIEDPKDQRVIVQKIILPGFESMNETTRNHLKKVLKHVVGKGLDCSGVFEDINTPFDFSVINTLEFVRIIYEEIERE